MCRAATDPRGAKRCVAKQGGKPAATTAPAADDQPKADIVSAPAAMGIVLSEGARALIARVARAAAGFRAALQRLLGGQPLTLDDARAISLRRPDGTYSELDDACLQGIADELRGHSLEQLRLVERGFLADRRADGHPCEFSRAAAVVAQVRAARGDRERLTAAWTPTTAA